MRNHLKCIYSITLRAVYYVVYILFTKMPWAKLYQPVYGEEAIEGTVRSCKDRWEAMEPHLGKSGGGALLDIGCNIGYFSFKAAEQGYLSFGVEADPIYQTTCNAIKSVHGIKNAHFLKTMIDEDFIKTMPRYDAIINLSVFHHWVKAYGAETAQNMMRGLAEKCDRMVFETGQSNEIGTKWCDKMDFMGADPEKWIKTFLKDIGFQKVKALGTFATGLTAVERTLFYAEK